MLQALRRARPPDGRQPAAESALGGGGPAPHAAAAHLATGRGHLRPGAPFPPCDGGCHPVHTRRPPYLLPQAAAPTLVTVSQVLLARTERLQARFNEQLRRREVTKEYVALVLLDPPPQPLQPSSLQQPLQPLPPLPPAGQACAAACATPPAPPTPPTPPPPPAPPAALREGTMLVHWMERRPRAPMRLSATSIEGACLRSGAWPLASPPRTKPPAPCALTPPCCPTMAPDYGRLGAVRERGAARAVHASTAARSPQRWRRWWRRRR